LPQGSRNAEWSRLAGVTSHGSPLLGSALRPRRDRYDTERMRRSEPPRRSVMNPHTHPSPAEPWLEVTSSRGCPDWLAEQNIGLACTTYQTGKLLLLGLRPNGQLAVFERTFNRCMGLWADGQTLWMSSLFQLWRFENALAPGQL